MEDFISELELSFSNLGSNKCWKRQIGDVVIWFSPITLHGQTKVTELLNGADTMGMNVINETKRVTLSYSIVGVNDMDLREYRDNVPRFPIPGKDGKPTKGTLDRFLYHKMLNWSSQFIDDAFSVLADLVESDQKDNLKHIKFENAKNAEAELIELEARVSNLRSELGKPQLVEASTVTKTEEVKTPEASVYQEELLPSTGVVEVDFDPFAAVESNLRAKKAAPEPASPPLQAVSYTAPSVDPAVMDRIIKDKDGKSVTAYVPNPSIPNEVIESSSNNTRKVAAVIDPPVANRNPRFSPPSR